nr:hypothetical protein [Tanacetum cinerariifolium]
MDSVIPNGQNNTLAEYMILFDADNHPPMLDKPLYDSWKSRKELYMQNKEHGRMILESIAHGLLDWPSIEVDGVIRLKKYAELSASEKLQANCDLKAANIILQGLPTDVYALVNHHRLKAYLEQHEIHVNQVWIMRERNQDPLALVSSHQNTPSHFNTYQTSYNHPWYLQQLSPSQSPQYGSIHPTQHYSTTYSSTPLTLTYSTTSYLNAYSSTIHQEACPQQQSIPQIEYTISIFNQQTHLAEFPQIDSGLAALVFKQGDNPIDAINKMMSFLSTIITSLQGRQSLFAAGTSGTRANISRIGKNNSGQQRVVKCFNCQDPEVAEGPVTQTVITHNAAYQADDLDMYDFNCDDFSTADMGCLVRNGPALLGIIQSVLGIKVSLVRDGKPITCNGCEGMLMGGFCFPCNLKAENSYTCYQNAYSFNNNSNYLPQPQYEKYLCNLCGNNLHDGYDCQQQFPFVYEQEPTYNQNYNDNYYPQDSPSFPCCDNCGGSHETFRCQPMDQNIDFSGSDQIQTLQVPEVHPPSEISNEYSKPENPNELFQKLLGDLKELAEYENSQSRDRPIFFNDDENHFVQNEESLENSSKEIATSNSNEEKEGPPQDSDIHQLIEECSIEICEEQKQIAPILSTKEPEHLLSMRYEHLSITPETESDEVIESNAENLLPIPSECEVTLGDKRECDELICENSSIIDNCDNHSEILFDSNNDDLSVYDDDFENIEYVEASLFDPEIVSVEEENVVQREEEEVDLEDISQIQDVVLREKLLSITRLISNIESLNDNSTHDHLIESALNTKLLSINSQRLDNKEQQEVKNVVEQPAERGNRIESLQNFRVIHKSSISFKNTSQISSIHAVVTILSTKEPEYSPSMGYENSNTTTETESDEIMKSGVEELVPILSDNEVTLEDKRECDVPISENSPICDDHSEIFSDSKNDDDISDVKYVEVSLPDPEIVSVEEENVVHQEEENNVEEEEVDLEDISQIQDIVLREKLLSITRLISNIESLNDNPTPDCVFILLSPIILSQIIFLPNSKLFAIIQKRREVVTPLLMLITLFLSMIHFALRLSPIRREPPDAKTDAGEEIPVVMNDKDKFDEDYYFFMFDKVFSLLSAESEDTIFDPEGRYMLPLGVENDDSDREVDAVDDLRVDNTISNSEHESSENEDSDFDNPSVPLPPSEPPDKELDFEIEFGDEISIVRNTIVEFECLNPRAKLDNDDFSIAKVFFYLRRE